MPLASDPIVKQNQARLSQKGLYSGNIDGLSGPQYRDALSRENAYDAQQEKSSQAKALMQADIDRKSRAAQAEDDRVRAEQQAKLDQDKANNAALAPELRPLLQGVTDPTQRVKIVKDFQDKQQQLQSQEAARQQAENDLKGLHHTYALGTGLGTGTLTGIAADKLASKWYNNQLKSRNAELNELGGRANSAIAMNPGPERDARLAGIANYSDSMSSPRRVPVGRLGSALGLGALGLYSRSQGDDSAKSDAERAMWTGQGYGELSAALKLGTGAAHDYVSPKTPLATGALSDIEAAKAMINPNTPRANVEMAPIADAPTSILSDNTLGKSTESPIPKITDQSSLKTSIPAPGGTPHQVAQHYANTFGINPDGTKKGSYIQAILADLSKQKGDLLTQRANFFQIPRETSDASGNIIAKSDKELKTELKSFTQDVLNSRKRLPIGGPLATLGAIGLGTVLGSGDADAAEREMTGESIPEQYNRQQHQSTLEGIRNKASLAGNRLGSLASDISEHPLSYAVPETGLAYEAGKLAGPVVDYFSKTPEERQSYTRQKQRQNIEDNYYRGMPGGHVALPSNIDDDTSRDLVKDSALSSGAPQFQMSKDPINLRDRLAHTQTPPIEPLVNDLDTPKFAKGGKVQLKSILVNQLKQHIKKHDILKAIHDKNGNPDMKAKIDQIVGHVKDILEKTPKDLPHGFTKEKFLSEAKKKIQKNPNSDKVRRAVEQRVLEYGINPKAIYGTDS